MRNRALGCLLVLGFIGCTASVDEEAWKKDGRVGDSQARDSQILDSHALADGDLYLPDAWPSGDAASGCRWRPVASGTNEDLHSVWGSSPGDIWAVGDSGTILHLQGKSWLKVSSPAATNLYEVTGTSAADVWAVGSGGTVLRYQGSQWQKVPQALTTAALSGVWSASGSGVWASGAAGRILSYDGSAWVKNAPTTTSSLYEIWGRPAGDVVAVGHNGSIYRLGSGVWSKEPSGTTLSLKHVFGPGAGPIWAVGYCASGKPKDCYSTVLVNKSGTSWTASLKKRGERLRGLWAGSDKDVWVVGDGCCGGAGCDCAQIRHFDGATWIVSTEAVLSKRLNSVWGLGSCDVWAVGDDGMILHRSPGP